MGRALILVVAMMIGLAGCADEPYILKLSEFDRSAPNFRKDPTDLSAVRICYSRGATSPETLQDMAAAECGKVQKVARYHGGRYFDCPLFLPASAEFVCVRR